MRWILLTLHIGLCGLIASCGNDESSRDDLAPVRPQWIARSGDYVYPQQGIRPEPQLNNSSDYLVYLEWQANPDTDIAGYRIWRISELATDARRRYAVADLQVPEELPEGVSQYSWVDPGDSTFGLALNLLSPDPETGFTRGYYWMLEAYDRSGNRSELSDSVYYRMINIPSNVRVDRVDEDLYSVAWSINPNPDIILSYYMIRVYSAAGGPDSVIWYTDPPIVRYGTNESANMDFRLALNPLMADCTYICQLNAVCNQRSEGHMDSLSGSAAYATFIYRN